MKKVISVVACGLLAACACDENQWEEVEVVNFEDTTYVEPAPVVAEPAPVVVETTPAVVEPAPVAVAEPIYIPTPAPVPACNCPCMATQAPSCCQAQSYDCQPVRVSKPKVTTTKKIITTTTTTEEPCGKPVCEPVVTVHEEIIPAEVSYADEDYTEERYVEERHNVRGQNENMVNVTVERNPYRSDIVAMSSSTSNVKPADIAKYKPEVYDVVASRATNRMLQDTASIYDAGYVKTIYLKDTRLLSSDLPYGSHRLRGVTRDIINGSRAFDVVNNPNNADYVVESSADWYVTQNSQVPALQYKLAMFDRRGQKVNEWVEIIRQVQD